MNLTIIYAKTINQRGLKASISRCINQRSNELINKLEFNNVLETEILEVVNGRYYTIKLSIFETDEEIIVQVVGLKRNARQTDFMLIDEIVYI